MAKTQAATRRTFIGAAGAGAAGVALSGIGMSSAHASTPTDSISGVVLTTSDPAKGVFELHVGERTLSITDLEFASKIAKAIA